MEIKFCMSSGATGSASLWDTPFPIISLPWSLFPWFHFTICFFFQPGIKNNHLISSTCEQSKVSCHLVLRRSCMSYSTFTSSPKRLLFAQYFTFTLIFYILHDQQSAAVLKFRQLKYLSFEWSSLERSVTISTMQCPSPKKDP